MADKLSLKWIDGNDVVTISGGTLSEPVDVHISGATANAPTFNVTTPEFWIPLSVLSGLAAGYCERRAVLYPEFITAVHGAEVSTKNWNTTSAAGRDEIVSNCMNNLALGSTGSSAIFTSTSLGVDLIGSAGANNYMTAMDAAIVSLIGTQNDFVTDAAQPMTTATLIASARADAAAYGTPIGTIAINDPTRNKKFHNALPADWAKERKWMLEQLKYTGSLGDNITPILGIHSGNYRILSAQCSTSILADGWFDVDGLYETAYSSGTNRVYIGEWMLANFEGYRDSYNMYVNNKDSSYVVSNISCYFENETGSVGTTKTVNVATYFDAPGSGLMFVDYTSFTKIAGGTAVTAEAGGCYCVESGGTLTLPPTYYSVGAVSDQNKVSAVTVESGGTAILSFRDGQDYEYASRIAAYDADWDYASSMTTAGALTSSSVQYQEYVTLPLPTTLTVPVGGTMYLLSSRASIPYEQQADYPDWYNCWDYNLYYSSWDQNEHRLDDLQENANATMSVEAGSSYNYTFETRVLMPYAGTLYKFSDVWVLKGVYAKSYACEKLNVMDGGVLAPSSNGVVFPATYTSVYYTNVLNNFYRNYRHCLTTYIPGGGPRNGFYCYNGTNVTESVAPTDNCIYFIKNASVTFTNTASTYGEIFLFLDAATVNIKGRICVRSCVSNGSTLTLSGGPILATCYIYNGCSVTLKQGDGTTTGQIDPYGTGSPITINGVIIGALSASLRPSIYVFRGGSFSAGVGESAPSTFTYFINVPPDWCLEDGCTVNLGAGFGLKSYTKNNGSISLNIVGYTTTPIDASLGMGYIELYVFNPFSLSQGTESTLITPGWNVIKTTAVSEDPSYFYACLCSATEDQSTLEIDGSSTSINGTVVLDGSSSNSVVALRKHDGVGQYIGVTAYAMNKGMGTFRNHYPYFYVRQKPTDEEIAEAWDIYEDSH